VVPCAQCAFLMLRAPDSTHIRQIKSPVLRTNTHIESSVHYDTQRTFPRPGTRDRGPSRRDGSLFLAGVLAESISFALDLHGTREEPRMS
jgi:hypothetical protein